MAEPNKIDILRGQEHIRDFLTNHIPQFWVESNHVLHRMWHAFFWEKEKPGVVLMTPSLHKDPNKAKDMEADFMRKFCQEQKPSALAMITEAWLWDLKGVHHDHNRIYTDPGYYEWVKSQGVKRECLIVSVETALGSSIYRWNIIREDGKEPRLGELDAMEDNEGGGQARFSQILLPEP